MEVKTVDLILSFAPYAAWWFIGFVCASIFVVLVYETGKQAHRRLLQRDEDLKDLLRNIRWNDDASQGWNTCVKVSQIPLIMEVFGSKMDNNDFRDVSKCKTASNAKKK